ncbi:hypothetical protein [Microbacterium hydrocarbonoxydans]|uniref:hypothetical protein n=1 Tax=Microbacterium hydrocarbonoxydans TaxID=273678 RepID=UPI0007BB43B3|nr:hypothetical protein [Microbacterium hydrocarbonoxydans]GAT74313.1 hypothetical protein MHM582_2818 [Microbacterium sp. HM58-2]
MSFPLDPAFATPFSELEWSARRPRSEDEWVIGDYARGFLILQRPEYIQVARRVTRGAPAMKMWTPSPQWAQAYVAYWTARLIRYRRGLPDVHAPASAENLGAGFRLDLSDPDGVFLHADGSGDWAGFGRGNEGAAVAFSRYWRPNVAEVLDAVLGEPGAP